MEFIGRDFMLVPFYKVEQTYIYVNLNIVLFSIVFNE